MHSHTLSPQKGAPQTCGIPKSQLMRPSSMVTRCIVESNQTTEHSRASNATVGARMEICYTMVFNEKKPNEMSHTLTIAPR